MSDPGLIADVSRWLARHREIGRLVLRHVGLGGRSAIVLEQDVTEPDRAELARQMVDAALADVASLGGVQRYVVLAYRPNDARSAGRYTLRVRSDDELDIAGVEESEPPTSEGLVAQTMRHHEVMYRQATQTIQAIVGDLRDALRDSRARCESLEKRHFDVVELLERLHTEDASRRLLERESSTRMDREQAAFDKVMLLAPTVLNRIAGGKVLPAPDMSEIALAAFFESLKPEQFEAITKTLEPPQLAAIFSMLERARTLVGTKEQPNPGGATPPANGRPT